MPCFIKESFLVRICIFLLKKLEYLYNLSVLKKIVLAINTCIKQSKTSLILNRYVKRNPYFLNSVFYTIIRKIGGLIDRIFEIIHYWFLPVVKNSFVVNEAKIINSFPAYEKFRILAVFIASIDFGFCFGSFIKGTLSQVSFLYICVPVVICALLILSKKIIKIFYNSFIYKCIKFLLD